jgi:hypothetical protein
MLQNLKSPMEIEIESEDKEKEIEDEEEPSQPRNITLKRAIDAIEYLKQFAVKQELSDFHDEIEIIYNDLDKLAVVSGENFKQKLLNDYFIEH